MSSNVTVIVTILNIDETALKFITPLSDTEFRIPENAAIGRTITNVVFRAVSVFTAGVFNVTYTVVGGTGQGIFDVDPIAGYVYLATNEPLDRESTALYNLTVEASNDGNTSIVITGTIRVIDINDNVPEFELNVYPALVSEYNVAGSTVITVSAFDFDIDGNTVGYGLVPVAGCNSSTDYSTFITENEVNFTIDSSTGEITLDSGMLDAEHANPNITLCVVAYSSADPTNITDHARVVIITTDVNEYDPFFTTTCQRFTINETTPVGTIVYTVIGSDSDRNPGFHYTMIANYLSIHNNGSIYAETLFDLRNPTGLLNGLICGGSSLRCITYSVTLHDQDPALPTARDISCFSVATIIDVDNYPPEFSSELFEGAIYKNASVGSIVKTMLQGGRIGTADLRVTANDPDVGYILEYSLEDSTFTTFEFDSDINSILSLAEPLDYETTMEYTFGIVVRDTGGRADTSMVHVTVLDANTPVFQQVTYNISVVEESSLALSIGMVSANSGEIQMLTYSIQSASPSGYFDINGQTGVLSIRSRVDREEYSQHELEVIAVYQGPPTLTGTTTVTIALTDINDNPPEFSQSQYYGRVTQNRSVGTPVMNVNNEQQLHLLATDADTGNNAEFNYQLVAPSVFAVDNMTGAVTVNNPLDFHQMSQRSFQVVAVDSINQSIRSDIATVLVIDVSNYDLNNTVRLVLQVATNLFVEETFQRILTQELNASVVVVNIMPGEEKERSVIFKKYFQF